MEFLRYLPLLLFCQSLAYAEELTEDSADPSTNYVFDLPDLVASYPTRGEEVQLEAFGAREVNFFFYLSYLSFLSYLPYLSCLSYLPYLPYLSDLSYLPYLSYLSYLPLIYWTLLWTTQRMGKKFYLQFRGMGGSWLVKTSKTSIYIGKHELSLHIFKFLQNGHILASNDAKQRSRLYWVSIGHPGKQSVVLKYKENYLMTFRYIKRNALFSNRELGCN